MLHRCWWLRSSEPIGAVLFSRIPNLAQTTILLFANGCCVHLASFVLSFVFAVAFLSEWQTCFFVCNKCLLLQLLLMLSVFAKSACQNGWQQQNRCWTCICQRLKNNTDTAATTNLSQSWRRETHRRAAFHCDGYSWINGTPVENKKNITNLFAMPSHCDTATVNSSTSIYI